MSASNLTEHRELIWVIVHCLLYNDSDMFVIPLCVDQLRHVTFQHVRDVKTDIVAFCTKGHYSN